MIGSQILNYRIQSKIGYADMGKVCLADHVKLDRKEATNDFHIHIIPKQTFRQYFINQANTIFDLQKTKISEPIRALHEIPPKRKYDWGFILIPLNLGKSVNITCYLLEQKNNTNETETPVEINVKLVQKISEYHVIDDKTTLQSSAHLTLKKESIIRTNEPNGLMPFFAMARKLNGFGNIQKQELSALMKNKKHKPINYAFNQAKIYFSFTHIPKMNQL